MYKGYKYMESLKEIPIISVCELLINISDFYKYNRKG